MEDIFTNIYEKSVWGDNNNKEYNGTSGGGSDIDYNITTYIPFLKNFILDKGNNEKKNEDIENTNVKYILQNNVLPQLEIDTENEEFKNQF